MKTLLTIIKIAGIAYICCCAALYFLQEKMIFQPEKLPADYPFQFTQPFEELHFTSTGNTVLTGVLFKAEQPKGVIFYLHGNAGSLRSWGEIAKTYTDLHYDLFMLDYRGYGKSGGSITNEKQAHEDVQLAYDSLCRRYNEKDIIVLGYSIGSGMASRLAAFNHPRLLILQAPYYNLPDLVSHIFPVIPVFLLKYKFATSTYIRDCRMPVCIFHGDKDEVIYYGSSVKLKALLKPGDKLITLKNQGHNGMSENRDYCTALQEILH